MRGKTTALAVLAASSALAPLMVGTVHAATSATLAACVITALWLYLIDRERPALLVTPVGAWLAVLLVWIAATTCPLPPGLHDAIDPMSASSWHSPLVSVRPSLSLSPGPTMLEIVKIGGAVAAVMLTASIGRDRRHRAVLLWGLIAGGVVVASVSGLQTLLGADRILGLYQPLAHVQDRFQTTFVNPNHAAQYFELVGFAALGLAIAGGRSRWPAALVALVLLGAALATGCGGAVIAIPVAAAAAAGLALARRWPRVRYVVPAVTLVVLLLMSAACLVRGPASVQTIARFDHGKLAHMPAVLRMIGDHGLVGIGRGAFRDRFAAYPTTGAFARYTHAESEILQLASELGGPLAMATLAIVVAAWFAVLARWRGSPHLTAALLGTFVTGVHSVIEFGLEFGGSGLPFAVLCGTLVTTRGPMAGRPVGRRASFALAAAMSAALLAAPMAIGHGSAAIERRNLDRDGSDFERAIVSALRWHPNSPDVAYNIALELLGHGRPDAALTLLNRCMLLDPANPLPHLVAAQALERLGGRSQAASEAVAALRLDPAYTPQVHRQLARVVDAADPCLALFHGDVVRAAGFAEYMLEHHGDRAIGRDLTRAIAASHPDDPTAARLMAAQEWSGGQRDDALLRLAKASEAAPCEPDLARYHASIRRAAGDAQGALDLVDRALACDGPRLELLHQRAMAALALDQPGDAQRAVRQMRQDASPHNRHAQALILVTEARIACATAHQARAVDYYRDALELCPDRAAVRIELGQLYGELDRPQDALDQFRAVREQTDAYPDVDTWIEDLESAR